MILLTPLYDKGQTKYDLIKYLLENNISISAVPGELNEEMDFIVISYEDFEGLIEMFSHYPWIVQNKDTYTFFFNGEKFYKASLEEPSLDEHDKYINLKIPEKNLNFRCNLAGLYVFITQK